MATEPYTILFQEKRTLCKNIIQYKKKHPNTKHKIITFGENIKTQEEIELAMATSI